MDTLIFILSKCVGLILRPDVWIVLILGFALWAARSGRPRGSRIALTALLFGLITVGVLPIGQMTIGRLEMRTAPPAALSRVDGIVVLGGGEDLAASRHWGRVSLGDGAERLATAAALARRFPQASLIYAGGSGRLRDALGPDATEADVALAFLAEQGIDRDRILIDPTSRNTAENARNARALVQAGEAETWLLVTSAFHMPRAMQSFAAAGWGDIIPYPVDYRTSSFQDGLGWNLQGNLEFLQMAIREVVGSFAYRLLKM